MTLDIMDRRARTNSTKQIVDGASFLLRHRPALRDLSFVKLRTWRAAHALYRQHLANRRGHRLLLWEATFECNYVAPYVARELNYKLVALPQNLEALIVETPQERVPSRVQERFRAEVRHLAAADAVFCIAREEQWLLRLHGIEAEWLPFYPARSVIDLMLQVRERRANSPRNTILILGTASNPATREGMRILLGWLKAMPSVAGRGVHIAGYGTEQLGGELPREGFTLHGQVTREKLLELLSETRAVVIHQKVGYGALTRISELLVAGIPVLANGIAARSAWQYPGLRTYETQEELAGLLQNELPMPPIPDRPIQAEKRFIDCLTRLANSAPALS